MQRPRHWRGLLFCIGLCAGPAPGADVAPSLRGHTGLIAVPHAEITETGKVLAGFTDLPQSSQFGNSSTYSAAFGLYSNLELSGRLVEADRLAGGNPIRDLSAAVKLRLFARSGWPSFAIGSQDIQGNDLLEKHYAVTSWTLDAFRLTGGYEWSPAQTNAPFAGLEWMPFSWLGLQAEHSDEADRAGIRLTVPLPGGFHIGGSAAWNLDDSSESSFGVHLSLPLHTAARSYSEIPADSATGFADRRPVELVLEPNLISFVGTEFGTADADLSLRTRLQAPLGRQGTVLLSALSPAIRSSDFDDGGNFESARSEPGLDQGLVQWYLQPRAGWHSLISGGYIRLFGDDTGAVLMEHAVFSGDGLNVGRLHAGVFAAGGRQRSIAIAEYRRNFPSWHTSLGLAVGRFVAGDNGARADIVRFFGDTAVTLFAKTTGEKRESAVGLGLSLPLSFAHDFAHGRFRLRGSERWGHSLQSTLGDRNELRPNLLSEPLPDRNLADTYLDLYRIGAR